MTQVAVTNTNNPAEPRPEAYTIPLRHELIELVLSGQKVKTYRFGKKFDYLKPGDKVTIQDSQTKELACIGVITANSYTTFKDLPINTPGHEPYTSKDHQRQVFSGYYAYIGRTIADDDPFLILEFQMQRLESIDK